MLEMVAVEWTELLDSFRGRFSVVRAGMDSEALMESTRGGVSEPG